MELPNTCETASTFIAIMESIWDGAPLPVYDRWHNAHSVARHYKLVKTAPSSRDTIKGYIYQFPNESRIFISRDGGMVDETKPRTR